MRLSFRDVFPHHDKGVSWNLDPLKQMGHKKEKNKGGASMGPILCKFMENQLSTLLDFPAMATGYLPKLRGKTQALEEAWPTF